MNVRVLLASLLLAAASPADAQQSRRIALVGGTLIDGTGARPIRNSVVLIDGERIASVGTVASLPVPAGYQVISTEGMSVLPGPVGHARPHDDQRARRLHALGQRPTSTPRRAS